MDSFPLHNVHSSFGRVFGKSDQVRDDYARDSARAQFELLKEKYRRPAKRMENIDNKVV